MVPFYFLTILVKFRSIIDGKSTVILVILSPFHSVVNNNNIYFAKGQVDQKGKCPSKLATILRATKRKENKTKQKKTTRQTFRQTCQYNEYSSLYTYHIITRTVSYA